MYEYFTSPEFARDLRTRLEIKSNLDELQRKEEDYTNTLWGRRKGFINQWFELDSKNDRIIREIAQDDKSSKEDNGSISP